MADRISTLPDVVLCHILSFLKTKQAVATSILSNRWKHLWLSVPVLDFPHTRLMDQEANFRFNDFVYSILLLRDASLPIKSFRLYVMYNFIQPFNLRIPSFAKWINFVLQCGGLECLELHVGMTDFDYREVSLSSDYEEDSLSCSKWRSFSLSNLTKAEVDSSYFQFPMKALQNVQSLSMCILTVQVYRHNDTIPTFHNLTRLDLDSLNYRWQFLVEVLKHCPKLQELYLDQAGLNSDDQTWTRKDDKENWVDPDFVLQCLSLHLRIFHLSSFLGLQGELQLARYILKNARVFYKP